MLIAEDTVAPADAIVVSIANGAVGVFEAARLYHDGMAATIVLPTWAAGAVDDAIRQLGIAHPRATALAQEILGRSGVPPHAVKILPEPVDGTMTEVAAVVAFARQHRPASLLVVTSRSHSARTRWLLRRALAGKTRVMVHSPKMDGFAADSWWRSREQSREVINEYLRWLNVLALGDPWAPAAASTQERPAAAEGRR
ncbi:MAG: YdcF family protein [Deltaproteobacteria bacterium]|nr:YdcF family protein [Deltaproteobacteria bacterium]